MAGLKGVGFEPFKSTHRLYLTNCLHFFQMMFAIITPH